MCGRKCFVDVKGQRRIGSSGFFVYCIPGHIAAFRHCSIFCYKSEMTRGQLPAIQSQWRALDCFAPQWVWFSDYEKVSKGAGKSLNYIYKIAKLTTLLNCASLLVGEPFLYKQAGDSSL